MEHFTHLHVILAQGPFLSSLYHSNFSIGAAEVSPQNAMFLILCVATIFASVGGKPHPGSLNGW